MSVQESVLMTIKLIHIDSLHCYTVVQEHHKLYQDMFKTEDCMYLSCFPLRQTYDCHGFIFIFIVLKENIFENILLSEF